MPHPFTASRVRKGAPGLLLLTAAALSTACSTARQTQEVNAFELAKLIARPLAREGVETDENPSEAEMLASIALSINQATDMAQKKGELAAVAQEYGVALRECQALCVETSSAQPMVRGGIRALRGGLDDNDQEMALGLLDIGSAVSRTSELNDKLEMIHSRVVACRLRLGYVVARHARPESVEDTVSVSFAEAVSFNRVKNDTLSLKNISGHRLTDVMVNLKLTGENGDTYSNVFYAESWDPNQTLQAICLSANPCRETVHNVRRVQVRVISNERTSRLADLKVLQ